jgi:hypothetical protein
VETHFSSVRKTVGMQNRTNYHKLKVQSRASAMVNSKINIYISSIWINQLESIVSCGVRDRPQE